MIICISIAAAVKCFFLLHRELYDVVEVVLGLGGKLYRIVASPFRVPSMLLHSTAVKGNNNNNNNKPFPLEACFHMANQGKCQCLINALSKTYKGPKDTGNRGKDKCEKYWIWNLHKEDTKLSDKIYALEATMGVANAHG
ncbi:hypothetical protein NC652_027974 [Populus alba x Populus x berolinensis]|nr:hypothetical protein NC652_027974 [Populus alba x Populus x berolinensis]